jgi:hypothetical protein
MGAIAPNSRGNLTDGGRFSSNCGDLPDILSIRQPVGNRTMPKAVCRPWLEFCFALQDALQNGIPSLVESKGSATV